MSKLIFATRQGSLILGATYAAWAVFCFFAGFENYMMWGLGLGMLILIYECLKGFSFSSWKFKSDLTLVNRDLYSILWVYLTVLVVGVTIFWEMVDLLGIGG